MSSAPSGRPLLGVLAAAAFAAVGFAVAMVFAPATLAALGVPVGRIQQVVPFGNRPRTWFLYVVLPIALYGLWRLLKGRWWIRRGVDPLVNADPEVAVERDVSVAGEDFDRVVEPTASPSGGSGSVARNRLRALARDVEARRRRVSVDEAARLIDEGSWTDDARAAAYLGTDDAPAVPLVQRLQDYLRAEPTERRSVRHALSAIEANRERGTGPSGRHGEVEADE